MVYVIAIVWNRWNYWVIIILAQIAVLHTNADAQNEKLNVLFLIADDMNDWVGCLGNPHVMTPNIDQLAAEGVLFKQAHAPSPVCNPSRTSVLLGKNPSSTGVYENNQWWIPNVEQAVTLPHHFKNHGYYVAGAGKIFHHTAGFNDPTAWDEYFIWNKEAKTNGLTEVYHYPAGPGPSVYPASEVRAQTKRNFDFAPLDISDAQMPDGKVADYAANFLLKNHSAPFFLAVGMFRPHIEWYVPKKYFDIYPLDKIELPPYLANDLADVPDPGKKWALTEASNHEFIKNSGNWRKAIQAYQASITFSDAQIGKVLQALKRGPNAENTIIVFWSDHGYHLGEKEHWHKQTLWYRSTHVPLLFKVPGLSKRGTVCEKPVSLVSLFKTLIELCNLPTIEGLDGQSLKPLIENPKASWSHPAIVEYLHGNSSVYADHYHYIRYKDGSHELYDLSNDPYEWSNLGYDANLQGVTNDLEKLTTDTFHPPVPDKSAFVFDEEEYSFIRKSNQEKIDLNKNTGFSWLTY